MAERRYRRYYIPIGGTLVAFFLVLQFWGLQIIDISGDVYCTDVCTSYFDVRNPTYRSIYIYNRNEIKLDFIPEIKDYQLYVKYYGKWVPMDFTMETRLGNIPKDRKYIFVFPRYSVKHFKLVGNKEIWKDIEWGFGFETEYLNPLWISGVQVGDKIVKELCVPLYKNWIDEIRHYKNCADCRNVTIESNKTDGVIATNGTYYEIKEQCYSYRCLDYIEEIPHKNEQVDCIKNGKLDVDGKLYEGNRASCILQDTKLCCYSNKEGGKGASTWRTDGSVDRECEDLITGKTELISSEGKSYLRKWKKQE